MYESWMSLNVSLVVWLLFIFSTYLMTSEKFRSKLKVFFYYSGVTFIFRKFVPTKKNILPTGLIWFIGIYFATYAFTAQRYESQLDKVELRYNIFTTQVAAGTKFSNKRLMKILNKKIPIKPYVFRPLSIIQSFADYYFHEPFFHSYDYSSAQEFRAEIINQWKNKLEGADFFAANLERTDFGGVNLKRVNFKDANLKGANFSRANLEGTDFRGANLEGADFRRARLKWADFSRASLGGADFRESNLEGAHFFTTRTDRADFNCANLEGVDFRYASLERADFGAANLKGAHFLGANLKRALFGGANLEDANFENANLEEVNIGYRNHKFNIDFFESLEGAHREDVTGYAASFSLPDRKPTTAEQLIMADNIYGIKRVPERVIENIKKYGCEKMLTERPDKWTKEFKRQRAKIIWQFNPLWRGDTGGLTNSVIRIDSK